MPSASKSVVDAIDSNWNVGTGGAKPAIYNSEAVSMFPTDDDWIMDLNWQYGKKRKRRNESYVGEKDYVGLRVHSRNDAGKEARLDEIVNEIYRVVTPANVSGYNVVDIIDQHRRESDKRTNTYIADLLVELVILSTPSASTPGSTTTSTITVDELTVNTSIAGNPTAALGAVTSTGKITAVGVGEAFKALRPSKTIGHGVYQGFYLHDSGDAETEYGRITANIVDETDGTENGELTLNVMHEGTVEERAVLDSSGNFQFDGGLTFGGADILTGPQLADLLMFGSANAAWVPCVFVGDNLRKFTYQSPHYRNVDATDGAMGFTLPLPTNKGSLKLYVTGLRVVVYGANATNKIDHAYLFANDFDTQTILINDGTDRTAQGVYEYALADTDVSGYTDIVVTLAYLVANASTLRLTAPMVECYYA